MKAVEVIEGRYVWRLFDHRTGTSVKTYQKTEKYKAMAEADAREINASILEPLAEYVCRGCHSAFRSVKKRTHCTQSCQKAHEYKERVKKMNNGSI